MTNKLLQIAYQQDLIFSCLDDICTSAVLSAYIFTSKVKDDELKSRTFIVDFIYINLISDLIEIGVNSINNEMSPDELRELLLITLPKQDDLFIWSATFIEATRKTKDLAEHFGLCNWAAWGQPVHQEFMNSIINIYSDFDAITKECDAKTAKERIMVAKRVIAQLTKSN